MKQKQVQPLFSLEATPILRELLVYARFFALNKSCIEEQHKLATLREAKSLTRIVQIMSSVQKVEEK